MTDDLKQLIQDLEEYEKVSDFAYLPLIIRELKRLPATRGSERDHLGLSIGRIAMEDMAFAESELGDRLFAVVDRLRQEGAGAEPRTRDQQQDPASD